MLLAKLSDFAGPPGKATAGATPRSPIGQSRKSDGEGLKAEMTGPAEAGPIALILN